MHVVVRGEPYPLDRITLGEAAALERVTGKSFDDLMKGGGSLLASQALVWLAMKRVNPSMRFSDTEDIAVEDIDIVNDDADASDDAPLATDDDAASSHA